jgi:hypothetical protein
MQHSSITRAPPKFRESLRHREMTWLASQRPCICAYSLKPTHEIEWRAQSWRHHRGKATHRRKRLSDIFTSHSGKCEHIPFLTDCIQKSCSRENDLLTNTLSGRSYTCHFMNGYIQPFPTYRLNVSDRSFPDGPLDDIPPAFWIVKRQVKPSLIFVEKAKCTLSDNICDTRLPFDKKAQLEERLLVLGRDTSLSLTGITESVVVTRNLEKTFVKCIIIEQNRGRASLHN